MSAQEAFLKHVLTKYPVSAQPAYGSFVLIARKRYSSITESQ
jgi:hypothetical protein